MIKKYYDVDCNLGLLDGKTVAIMGYGSQGHAHALNLKESGVNVIVGLRADSKSASHAKEAGLKVMDVEEAAELGDVIMMLVPDEAAGRIYNTQVAKHMKEGNILMFAHGFNIHYHQIQPAENIDVIMVAPKGPGHTVRTQYLEGKGVPSLIAVFQDYSGKAKDFALAYASGIGAGRAGILETTFKEETETDLFGEQCVLCGGVTELVKSGFETLVEAGYQPEIAYFECMHELKLIVDLMYEGGMSFMRYSISDTAEWGDYTKGPDIIGEEARWAMQEALIDIQDGTFAKNWLLENMVGRPRFNALKRQNREHLIEEVGADLRGMMPWLKETK